MPTIKLPPPEDMSLPPKLESVLVRIALSCDLNKTRAAKLPYLVDVVAKHILGHCITEGTHQTWEHGVVTAEAWRHLDREKDSLFEIEPAPWSEEKRVKYAGGPYEGSLSPEEEAIVDAVVAEFGGVTATELGLVTKRMNPSIQTWGANHRADVNEDAYERLSWEYQEMSDIAAKSTPERESRPITDIEEAIA